MAISINLSAPVKMQAKDGEIFATRVTLHLEDDAAVAFSPLLATATLVGGPTKTAAMEKPTSYEAKLSALPKPIRDQLMASVKEYQAGARHWTLRTIEED